MSIKYVYKSNTKQERIKNGTKALEGFINNGFRSMGVSHRVELVNVSAPDNVQNPQLTATT
jgi:hypothetical protein